MYTLKLIMPYLKKWYTIKIHPIFFILSLFISLFYIFFSFLKLNFYLFFTITVTPYTYPQLVSGSQI